MLKKLTLFAMSVAALVAFAVPAVAQAGFVTDAEGNEAIVVTAEGTDVTLLAAGATIECGTVKLSLGLSGGGTSHYSGTGTALGNKTTPHVGPCQTNSGFAVHINSLKVTVQIDGGGTGSSSFEYTYTITTPLGNPHCTFNATNVPVTYTPTTSTIDIKEASMVGSEPGCATSGKLSGVFHMLDANKDPTSIH